MRRVIAPVVAFIAVVSSGVAFASSDAVVDLKTQLHALSKDSKPAATDTVRDVDVGFSGVNVTRDANTGGSAATTSAEKNAAASPGGVHH